MGRLIVFEEIDNRLVKDGDIYIHPADDMPTGSIEVAPITTSCPILRRLTDEEVAKLVAPKSSAELHSLAIQKAIEELGPVNQAVSPRNDAPPSITYLTQEQLAKMDCPYPPEPGYEDEKPADDERGRFVRETAARMLPYCAERYNGPDWEEKAVSACIKHAESLAARLFGEKTK